MELFLNRNIDLHFRDLYISEFAFYENDKTNFLFTANVVLELKKGINVLFKAVNFSINSSMDPAYLLSLTIRVQ